MAIISSGFLPEDGAVNLHKIDETNEASTNPKAPACLAAARIPHATTAIGTLRASRPSQSGFLQAKIIIRG